MKLLIDMSVIFFGGVVGALLALGVAYIINTLIGVAMGGVI